MLYERVQLRRSRHEKEPIHGAIEVVHAATAPTSTIVPTSCRTASPRSAPASKSLGLSTPAVAHRAAHSCVPLSTTRQSSLIQSRTVPRRLGSMSTRLILLLAVLRMNKPPIASSSER